MKTAFLGLGTMGYPMAGHLATAGHDVQVYNRTTQRAYKWQQHYGGTVGATACEAASGADAVCMCLGNDDDVRSVVYGNTGVLEGMKAGAVLIDHTTTSRTLALELAQSCQQKQCLFLDAPVSGGEVGAQKGSLTIMIGGQQTTCEQVSAILECYSKKYALMGSHGAGQLAKMVNQICIAGLVQGLAEGLHFALRNEVDCDKLLSVISKGAAQSWQMDNRGRTMVADEFDFGFSVKWMVKDLRMCLEQSEQSNATLPITRLVLQRYQQLLEQGDGSLDTSSLIRLLEKH